MSKRIRRSEASYRVRMLGALTAVLVLAIGLVSVWPVSDAVLDDLPFSDRPQETIQIDEIVPTTQAEAVPPPPAPLPPVVVPNDVLIEEPLTFDDGPLPLADVGDDARLQTGDVGPPTASRLPDVDARLVRAVQPDYPAAAREEGLRARIVVAVRVDARGRVSDASVVERWRLSDAATEAVTALRFGLEDAALDAARRSLFRPAESGGRPVATETTITFTFGNES